MFPSLVHPPNMTMTRSGGTAVLSTPTKTFLLSPTLVGSNNNNKSKSSSKSSSKHSISHLDTATSSSSSSTSSAASDSDDKQEQHDLFPIDTYHDNQDQAHNEDVEDMEALLQIKGVHLEDLPPREDETEDILAYIQRRLSTSTDTTTDTDTTTATGATSTTQTLLTWYRRIVGAASEFKQGDLTLQVAAANDISRQYARTLLARTKVYTLQGQSLPPQQPQQQPQEQSQRVLLPPLHRDALYDWIVETTPSPPPTSPTQPSLGDMTLGQLKTFILEQPAEDIHTHIMPYLHSDVIACLVKLMSHTDLVTVGAKLFNPLPGSNIGAQGYLSARVQPNSPTDNVQDIVWQVFDAFSYAVGDLVLGTNPVSSEPESVAAIEQALYHVLCTFDLQNTMSHCVLSHIDIQAKVYETIQHSNKHHSDKDDNHPEAEEDNPPPPSDPTGIWFQSIAGSVAANQTFDVTIAKMKQHVQQRKGRYALYGETGQGADFTNGHGAGVDMVVHEARKYGFLRALKQQALERPQEQWIHVNDVAGFIGPEVFKSKEQLVRCCLEDTVMGKLHGLTIGLDICSTLHMDVTLDDLDWCIDSVMPANPGYLMALPTKNDPMLSYLTTSFADHVRIREKFGYKINDDMWAFYQRLGVIDTNGKPTEHFGQPLWVYYKYCQAKGDTRSQEAIYEEGRQCIRQVEARGVPIAQGYGDNYWDPPKELDREVRRLYEDAKISLWTELGETAIADIPQALLLTTQAKDRKDYVYHPESGEKLSAESVEMLRELRDSWRSAGIVPDVQVVISDGLNALALTDEGHLMPFLVMLREQLEAQGLVLSPRNLVFTQGRVRAGYMVGEVLFGCEDASNTDCHHPRGIIHIIGERPGSGHHNFSAYLTAQPGTVWGIPRKVDHDVTRVVSGISDTAFHPVEAAKNAARIFKQLWDDGSTRQSAKKSYISL